MTRTAPQLQPLTQSDLMPLPAVSCPACHGSGFFGYFPDAIECPNCHGHGEVFQLDADEFGGDE